MAKPTTNLSDHMIQQAQLIKQVSKQMIDVGTPAKCRAAYGILVPKFHELLEASRREETDLLASCYNFLYLLAWRGCEELSVLAPFAEHVSIPFGTFISKFWSIESRETFRRKTTQDERQSMRIAYVTRSVELKGSNAIAKVVHALISGHCQSSDLISELTMYLLKEPDEVFLEAVKNLPLELIVLPPSNSAVNSANFILEHARKSNVDAMLCDEPGPIQTLVYQRRAAPLQAYVEMGFAPWGIEGLDLGLIGISKDPALQAACCKTVAPSQRPSQRSVVDKKVDPGDVKNVRDNLSKLATTDEKNDPIIFGNFGRLAKITPIFLKRAEQILQRQSNAVLLIGGTGNSEVIDAFLATTPVCSRIRFVHGFVDGCLVSAAIDVFLDTDPFPGGISCVECQIKSVPVIWRKGFATTTIDLLEDMRDPELSADDDEDYVNKALSLADPSALDNAQMRALRVAEQACDNVGAARQIEEVLRSELRLFQNG